jgi:hypothetical protein
VSEQPGPGEEHELRLRFVPDPQCDLQFKHFAPTSDFPPPRDVTAGGSRSGRADSTSRGDQEQSPGAPAPWRGTSSPDRISGGREVRSPRPPVDSGIRKARRAVRGRSEG